MICPNPECKRIVSPYDEKCQHCGTPLKPEHPIKDYEKKAGQIVKDAELRAEDVILQIRSGFKDSKKFEPFVSAKEDNKSSRFHKDINEKESVYHESANKQVESKYHLRSDDIDEIINQRKDVRVKEAYGIVFSNPEIIGNPDNSRKATITDWYYYKEGMDVEGIDPLEVNAFAYYDRKSNRYAIAVLDGYLNFMLVAECFFKYKDKAIIDDLKKIIIKERGRLSLKDTKRLISPFIKNEQEFSEIMENAFAPCLETIAHEIGHICLNHCDDENKVMTDDKSRSRERQADEFAGQVINSFYVQGAQIYALEAQLKNCFTWVVVEIGLDKSKQSTHPLAKERFKNAVRTNSELAEKLGITEDVIDQIDT